MASSSSKPLTSPPPPSSAHTQQAMDPGGNNNSAAAAALPDSANCLKFGQKVYFAETSAAGSSSSSSSSSKPPSLLSSSSSSSPAVLLPPLPPPPAALGRRRKAAEAVPPRCQVEGCNVDLTGSKPYYCRHKVCGNHSKAPRVVVAGFEQRFCQQCSRFHQLTEFDQGKRSCRRRLAGHNERRRKPPPGPLSARFGRLASSFPGDPSRYRGFMMDFAYPRPPATSSRDLWPAARPMNTFPNAGLVHQSSVVPAPDGLYPYQSGPSPLYPPDIPTDDCLATGVNSSCALSLLSTGPTSFPSGSNYVTNHDQGPHSSNMPACESAGPWGFRASGPYVARGNPSELEFGGGELELALQRSGGPQTDRESGHHAFDSTGASHGTNWPL